MEWTVTIEGRDEYGEVQRAQVQIEKGFERLTFDEIGLSINDGKRTKSALQEFVVKQELATYALARRGCVSCERLRPGKDYASRKIRTVFGTVAVKNPRWMVCQRCFPHLSLAFTLLGEIFPDRATPELMEVTARLGSMLPYRKARSSWPNSGPLNRQRAIKPNGAQADLDAWRLPGGPIASARAGKSATRMRARTI